MKRLCLDKKKMKRGVASLYVVLFATLLFGVVTLSFMRIMLSEAGQSSDDDLSQSAYDSAMAGVEDAKRAVNQYYTCLNSHGADCKRSTLFKPNCENGIGLADYLYNYTDGEVLLSQTNDPNSVDNDSDQAYTCVVISDRVPDYRGTLTADTRTRVIPLSVYDRNNPNTQLPQLKKIKFQWYSRLNAGAGNSTFKLSDGKLKPFNERTIPPTIQLSFIHFKDPIGGIDFNTANNNGDYQFSTLLLLPSTSGSNDVSWTNLQNAGNVTKSSPDRNESTQVTCSSDATEFACTVTLEMPSGFAETDSIFLIASLPYGDAMTDFAASMLKDGDVPIDLIGSQISVDSTGRTNQLVRRVETRLDPADLYFPYPLYALDMDGTDEDSLKKNFWITANCWYSSKKDGSYEGGACDNNGQLGN